MRPRTLDLDAERAHLADELRAIARKAYGRWDRVSTSGQAELLQRYRHERSAIRKRLRELRRLEKKRARTDARRRIAAAAALVEELATDYLAARDAGTRA